ncbi:MAG: 4Fe-4S binding protein, partial [Coriobacteriales bacterium]|nr:4Fe-4S binding protein [Coriobacteriales bacterium]
MNSGKRIRYLRYGSLTLIFALVLFSLIFDTGFGSPSAAGIGRFFLICPLGALEAMLAGKVFIPVAFVSMLVVMGVTLLVGRAWCAWGCPAQSIRAMFGRGKAKLSQEVTRAQDASGTAKGALDGDAA